MNEQEFSDWEDQNSFKSLRRVLAQAEKEWMEIKQEQDIPVFQKKYADVLSIQDESIVPHIKVFSYQSIINREGIYKTGNHYHKVIGDYIITVPESDYNRLKNVKSVDEFSDNNSAWRIIRYADTEMSGSDINGARVSATCTPGQFYKEAQYQNSASKCRDGRRAYISALSYMYVFTGYGDFNGTTRYGDFYQQAVMIQLWAKIRNWDGGDKQLARQINKFGDVIYNNQPSYSSFLYIYAEGKSRGVGDNWAVIFCPNPS